LVSEPTSAWLGLVADLESRMGDAMGRFLDRHAQRIDLATSRLGRPSSLAHRQRLALFALEQRMQHAARMALQIRQSEVSRKWQEWPPRVQRALSRMRERGERSAVTPG
jgi:exodeoxyribonuclease VII large subunit